MSEPEQRPETRPAPIVGGVELVKLAVEGWKKTVDVQQHFNDLELRVRNYAITFAAAVLGLVGWALKEGADSFLPAGLLAIGTLGWVAFYLMDRHWYHRFLDGAVAHGQSIEEWLCMATGTKVFSLATGIKQASGIPLAKQPKGLWPWLVGLFVTERKLRSHHRINLFYWGFALAFAVLTVVFYMHAAKPVAATSQAEVMAPATSPSITPARAVVAPVTEKPTPAMGPGRDAAPDVPSRGPGR
jgi:hypothetical protein